MRRIIGLFILILPLFGSEIDSIIKNAPSERDYPDAGALILLDRTTLRVDKDKNTLKERYLVIKILKDRGREEYGDIKQKYDKESCKIETLIARTHLSTGEIRKPEKKAISDVSAPEVWRASAYTRAMLRVVSFPAVDKGSVIEYRYRMVPLKKRKGQEFFGEIKFGTREPVIKKEVIIIIPKGIELKYKLLRSDTKPEIIQTPDSTIYKWTIKDIPMIVRESDMPPFSEVSPRLVYSTFKSWEDVGRWIAKRFYKPLDSSKEIKEVVRKLFLNKDRKNKIRDIFLYVVNGYRNIWLDLGDIGYKPHKPSEIFKQKYGECLDKSALLITMLKEAGIEAYPAMVRKWVGREVIKDIPSPSYFNGLLVAIPEDKGFTLLDPILENYPYGYLSSSYQAKDLFIIEPDNSFFTKVPLYESSKSISTTTAEIELKENGDIKGKFSTKLTGYYDYSIRRDLKEKTPKERKQFFERKMSQVSTGTKLLSYSLSALKDLTKPSWVKASFSSKGYATIQKDRMRFKIPPNLFNFEWVFWVISKEKRKYPFIIHPLRTLRYSVKIKLPKGYGIYYLPDNLREENEYAKASITYIKQGNRILYVSDFTIKKWEIDPEGYKSFKSLCDEFLDPKKREIILKEVK